MPSWHAIVWPAAWPHPTCRSRDLRSLPVAAICGFSPLRRRQAVPALRNDDVVRRHPRQGANLAPYSTPSSRTAFAWFCMDLVQATSLERACGATAALSNWFSLRAVDSEQLLGKKRVLGCQQKNMRSVTPPHGG